MWPACQICGKPVRNISDEFCRGSHCDGKPMTYPSVKKPHTKKKLTRAMIKTLNEAGVQTVVCKGCDEAIEFIESITKS